MEKIAYKPLRNSTRIAALTTAIGTSLFLEYITILLLGANQRIYPDSVFPAVNYSFFGLMISNKDIFIIISAILLMVLLQVFIKKTKTGKAMRAVSIDREATQLIFDPIKHPAVSGIGCSIKRPTNAGPFIAAIVD